MIKSSKTFRHLLLLLSLCYLHIIVGARKHHLELEDDSRRLVHITSFGFFKGGFMEVNVHELIVKPAVKGKTSEIIGFTVDRTLKDGINPYPHDVDSSCALPTDRAQDDESTSSIMFALDFDKKMIKVTCSPSLSQVRVYKTTRGIPMSIGERSRRPNGDITRNIMTQLRRRKRNGTASAAILGNSDFDPSIYYDSAENNDTTESTESEGLVATMQFQKNLGTADQVPDAESMTDKKSDGRNANPSVESPSNPVVQPQVSGDALVKEEHTKANAGADVGTGNQDQPAASSGSVAVPPSPDINGNEEKTEDKKSEGTGRQSALPVDSSEETSFDDISQKTPFSDPGLFCTGVQIPLNISTLSNGDIAYSFQFVVYIAGEDCEGLYNLYFHNCADDYGSRVTLNVSLVEENVKKNYLSAGEMPLPALYSMMSMLFFLAGIFWIFILKKSKKETGVAVFKIHYLMGALVFVKSLSLFFHSVNYHFIQTEGTHVEGWAVLYYIAHLLKGALLFITILLIGTGYAFVKHLLSDKDKKIFMIVIPLQVLANVAQIIIEESEEGEVVHTTWQVIFISVDLLCCCAILIPVVWSIRHLQEASQTDGKAASNLRKLKLFRHFYIIVVCYIYFTRIIVQMLLKITVPFQYEWLDDMFREMTTFIFFVLTGYKFRPAVNNPYLELAHDSDDEDMDIAMTDSGLTEGAVKRGYKPKKKTLKEIVLFDPNEEETDDDEEVLLEKRREASHDLD